MLDLTETFAFLELLQRLDIPLFNITAGSPYYTPRLQRPALFPPSDGYLPPEDPLVGVARQIDVVRTLKRRFPAMIFVRSAYSYLHEWLHAVAAELVRRGFVDSVGLGRMMLSYPDLPHDVLGGLPLARKRICRTFSDCTTAPRKALISGCFPLDPCSATRTIPTRSASRSSRPPPHRDAADQANAAEPDGRRRTPAARPEADNLPPTSAPP